MASITDVGPAYADEAGRREQPDFEVRKTLLAGLIGAVVGAAGYFIYSRLEEEQREAIRQSVGKYVGDRLSDVRSQLKF